MAANIPPVAVNQDAQDIEKNRSEEAVVDRDQDEKYATDDSNDRKQDGVKTVEAITITWSKKTLWLMFVL